MHERIIKNRLLIVVTSIGITLLSLLLFPRLNINSNLDDYVPDHLENQVYLKQMGSIFGGSEIILVMLQDDDVLNQATLNRLQLLATDLTALDGIDRCLTPFDAKEIAFEDGFMSMDPILDGMSVESVDYTALKKKVASNKKASSFFSDDFSLVSLILTKTVVLQTS